MAKITTSLDPNDGNILVFQHHRYDANGWDLALRAGVVAVRIADRDDKSGGIGSWIRYSGNDNDPTRGVGDLNLAYLWPRNTRQINGWAFAWPVTLQTSQGGGTATGGGAGGAQGAQGAQGAGGVGGAPGGGGGGGGGQQGALNGGVAGQSSDKPESGQIRTNYTGGTPGAVFGGVRTNFSGGKPGVVFIDPPKAKDANAPKQFDVKKNIAAGGGGGGAG